MLLGDPSPEDCDDHLARRPSRAVLESAHVRTKKGELAGPSPVDRGRPGSGTHLLPDANGLPLRVGLSAANTHDGRGLRPVVAHFRTGHASHSDRPEPRRLHADNASGLPGPAATAAQPEHRRPHRRAAPAHLPGLPGLATALCCYERHLGLTA
ncbi:hypothetical protein GCM10010398_67950 [Streptomyces fimbriatus]